MSVQCKAYLTVDGAKQPKEIRSFRLDEGAVSNYDYLRRKISTIFPNLGLDEDGKIFTLLWKDGAGDMITFSSDDELIAALGEVATDGVFRIYVNLKRSGHAEVPWQEYAKEVWKFLNDAQTDGTNPCGSGQPGTSHPYSRPNCRPTPKRTGCGQPGPNWCGSARSQRGSCNNGFSFDAFPMFFPGFHAEVWGYPNDGFTPNQQQCNQQTQSQKTGKEQPEDPTKPSTSSS